MNTQERKWSWNSSENGTCPSLGHGEQVCESCWVETGIFTRPNTYHNPSSSPHSYWTFNISSFWIFISDPELCFTSQVSVGLLHGRASHIIWPPSRWQRIKPSIPPNRGPLDTEEEEGWRCTTHTEFYNSGNMVLTEKFCRLLNTWDWGGVTRSLIPVPRLSPVNNFYDAASWMWIICCFSLFLVIVNLLFVGWRKQKM